MPIRGRETMPWSYRSVSHPPFLLTDPHIWCVHRADAPGLMFNDTLMAEAVQMFRLNQDKWEPFVSRCKVNMVVLLSYLDKLPVECRHLADFRYREETVQDSHSKKQLQSFLPPNWFSSFILKHQMDETSGWETTTTTCDIQRIETVLAHLSGQKNTCDALSISHLCIC